MKHLLHTSFSGGETKALRESMICPRSLLLVEPSVEHKFPDYTPAVFHSTSTVNRVTLQT